jgi:hypothetical protein
MCVPTSWNEAHTHRVELTSRMIPYSRGNYDKALRSLIAYRHHHLLVQHGDGTLP